MSKKLYYLIFCMFIIFALGMAKPPERSQVTVQKPISGRPLSLSRFLVRVKSAYEQRILSDFMQLIDGDYPARFEFEAKIEEQFLQYQQLYISFSVDSELADKGKTSVRFTWIRKSRDSLGAFSKQKGSAQFILSRSKQGYKILSIGGKNPFF